MDDLDDARRRRRAAADHLLTSVEDQLAALEGLAVALRQARAARSRVRERVEDAGGHEADTLFGSWLDSDDRISDQLEHLVKVARASADATRAHIASTELLLFEMDPGPDDPRASSPS